MKVCKVEKKREVVNVNYEVCDNDYCCRKMKYAMTSEKLKHYDDGSGNFNHAFSIEDGKLVVPLAVNYDSGGHYRTEIDYCPWCSNPNCEMNECLVANP